jgi:hypothetical protein
LQPLLNQLIGRQARTEGVRLADAETSPRPPSPEIASKFPPLFRAFVCDIWNLYVMFASLSPEDVKSNIFNFALAAKNLVGRCLFYSFLACHI